MIRRPMAGRPDRRDAWSGYNTGWAVIGTLFAGILAWGGIGYVLDRIFDFRWLFLPIGMVVGVAGSIYLVMRRYGTDDRR